MVGIGVGPAGALDRFPGPWHRDGVGETALRVDDHIEGDDLSCGEPTANVPTTVAPTANGSLTQTVTVVVPPIVRVQSAESDLRVITNTARPPAPGDQVYLRGADGNYTPANDALVARVMTANWADGSWCSTNAEHRSVG